VGAWGQQLQKIMHECTTKALQACMNVTPLYLETACGLSRWRVQWMGDFSPDSKAAVCATLRLCSTSQLLDAAANCAISFPP
jgi:hypothetical protein